MANGILTPCNVAFARLWNRDSEFDNWRRPTLQRNTWLWDDMPFY